MRHRLSESPETVVGGALPVGHHGWMPQAQTDTETDRSAIRRFFALLAANWAELLRRAFTALLVAFNLNKPGQVAPLLSDIFAPLPRPQPV